MARQRREDQHAQAEDKNTSIDRDEDKQTDYYSENRLTDMENDRHRDRQLTE